MITFSLIEARNIFLSSENESYLLKISPLINVWMVLWGHLPWRHLDFLGEKTNGMSD